MLTCPPPTSKILYMNNKHTLVDAFVKAHNDKHTLADTFVKALKERSKQSGLGLGYAMGVK